MYAVIDGFAGLIGAAPDAVLALDRIGARRPATPSDVPAVAISLSIDDLRTSGLGSITRAGDLPDTPPTNDIRGTTYRGLLSVEVWATSLSEAATISRKLQDRATDLPRMRRSGFIKLQPAGLEPIEQSRYAPANGSPFAVWKQPMSYRFAFMAERPAEPSDGGPIRHIGVDIRGSVADSLSLPPANP